MAAADRRNYTAGMSGHPGLFTCCAPRPRRGRGITLLAFACVLAPAALAQGLQEFSTIGLPRSEGLVVRVQHPSNWKRVAADDEMALAELRGQQGRLTGILQIGRGRQRADIASACRPELASTMLQGVSAQEPDTRVTDVSARTHQGRPGFELRYERNGAPTFMRVHSVIVCLKDSKLVVSCAGMAEARAALEAIEPLCTRVLASLSISED
jgi:hypothetical protein